MSSLPPDEQQFLQDLIKFRDSVVASLQGVNLVNLQEKINSIFASQEIPDANKPQEIEQLVNRLKFNSRTHDYEGEALRQEAHRIMEHRNEVNGMPERQRRLAQAMPFLKAAEKAVNEVDFRLKVGVAIDELKMAVRNDGFARDEDASFIYHALVAFLDERHLPNLELAVERARQLFQM